MCCKLTSNLKQFSKILHGTSILAANVLVTAGDERSLLPDRYSGLDYNTQSVWYRWDSKIPSDIFNVFYRNRKISSIVISQAKAFPAHGKGMTVLGPKGWAFGCSTQKGIIVGVKHMTYEYIVEHDRW